MPSVVDGFEYDIFVSYRQNDNRSGWVTEFVKHLREELAATIKEPVSVYFDSNPFDGLLELHNVDKSLEGKLRCLIFIPILSQTYCDANSFAWQHEFCAFNRLAKADRFGLDVKLNNGNVTSRILPVKIHELDTDDRVSIEREIGGALRAVEFIYREPGVNRPLLSIEQNPSKNENQAYYRNQVNKVANAIKQIISVLKSPHRASTPVALPLPVPSRKRINVMRVGITAGTVLIFLIACYLIYVMSTSQIPDDAVNKKSIAVLPFDNISNDTRQEYFGDGIADEIINALAQRSNLKVIARTSSFHFKGKNEDMREIGHRLGVDYIIEGSVRQEGDTVRITAQLIKASDGSHIWSSSYNRTLDNVLRLQDEIASEVSKKLDASLFKKQIGTSQFRSYEAQQLYFLGEYFTERPTELNFQKADSVFKQALAAEPNNAKIWAALATVYILQENNGFEKKIGLATDAAFKAIGLDSLCADAHSVLGYINATYWYKWDEAGSNLNKALELEPTNALAMYRLGLLYSTLGKFDMAVEMQKNSIRHDPLNTFPYLWMAFNLVYTERYDEARKTLKALEELTFTPGGWPYLDGVIDLLQGRNAQAIEKISREERGDWRFFGLAQAYYIDGQTEKSDSTRDEMIKRFGNSYFQIGEIYALRGQTDEAFVWFDKAFEARVTDFIVLKKSPWLKKITHDPRYALLLKKLNLPPD